LRSRPTRHIPRRFSATSSGLCDCAYRCWNDHRCMHDHAIRAWTRRHSAVAEADEASCSMAAAANENVRHTESRTWLGGGGNLTRQGCNRATVSSSGVQHRGWSRHNRLPRRCVAVCVALARHYGISDSLVERSGGYLSTAKGSLRPLCSTMDQSPPRLRIRGHGEYWGACPAARLRRGEALLSVAHEGWRQFEVVAGGGIRDSVRNSTLKPWNRTRISVSRAVSRC